MFRAETGGCDPAEGCPRVGRGDEIRSVLLSVRLRGGGKTGIGHNDARTACRRGTYVLAPEIGRARSFPCGGGQGYKNSVVDGISPNLSSLESVRMGRGSFRMLSQS